MTCTANIADSVYGDTDSVRRLKFALTGPTGANDVKADDLLVFCPMEAIGERGELDTSERRRFEDVPSGFTRFNNGDVVVVAKITPCF